MVYDADDASIYAALALVGLPVTKGTDAAASAAAFKNFVAARFQSGADPNRIGVIRGEDQLGSARQVKNLIGIFERLERSHCDPDHREPGSEVAPNHTLVLKLRLSHEPKAEISLDPCPFRFKHLSLRGARLTG